MLKKAIVIGFLATILLSAREGPAQEEIRIFYPPHDTTVREEVIPVEGMVTDPSIFDLEVVVNDEDDYEAEVQDFFFSEEVYLVPGRNTITVGEQSRQVFLETGEEDPPPDFLPAFGHFGLEDGCVECHELEDDGTFTFDGEPQEVCRWCHADLVRESGGEKAASVHGPVAKGECLTCHQAHISRQPGLLVEKPPECRDCHQETFDKLEKERFVHGPLNLGECRFCHNIHTSSQPSLLKIAATELCTECHAEIAVKPGTPPDLMPHAMVPEGECGRCHEPHSSENPRLMRQPSSRICYECHPKERRSFHEEKGFSIYACISCHDLHNPTTAYLIVDSSRSLCLECHQFREDALFSHEFIAEGGCFVCHAFHASPLLGEIADICLRCHGASPALAGAHGGIDISSSRCTRCHFPHQSDKPNLMYPNEHSPYRKRECTTCHNERAELLAGDGNGICLSCHPDKDKDSPDASTMNFHPALDEVNCSHCHRAHASEEPSLLREPTLNLCLQCHRSFRKIRAIKPKSSHEAVLKGECPECHDPHRTPNASLLKEQPGALCSGCHLETLRNPAGGEWRSQHSPVKEKNCLACHRPHTARKPKLLRSKAPESCRSCHQDFFSALKSVPERQRHEPVRSGECRKCHLVHGSDGRALLLSGQDVELCRSCHPAPTGGHHILSIAELKEKTGFLVSDENRCSLCHLPHASPSTNLLKSLEQPLCQSCHRF